MSLEKMSEEIILQAKKEAEIVKSEARKEAERIILSAKNAIEEKRNAVVAETAGLIDAMLKRELASAKLDEKRLMLDAKKDAIEKVYASLREKILALDKKSKEKIYAGFVSKAKKEFEPVYVYARKDDEAIVKKVAGKAKVLTEEILGGLVFESADRKLRVDMSFDSVLATIKSGYIKDTSKILFGEGA